MNDILKYWPINFDYCDNRMSLPMGRIVCIEETADKKGCVLHVVGDTWTSETTTYDDVMRQWSDALRRFAPKPDPRELLPMADRDGRPII